MEEIYYNLLLDEKEIKIKARYGYMNNQKYINEQMRAILIDWIIEVHFHFKLNEETLFQTIWIIDTYLTYQIIPRNKLQLLGITSLLIACKYNEIYYPSNNKLINITNNAYEVKDLLQMEREVLEKLEFNIMSPNPMIFYDIISKSFNFNKKQYNLGIYFLESSLIDYHMIKFPSSIIALSCAYIVMKFFCLKNYIYLYNISNICNKVNNNEQPKLIKESAKNLCILVKNINNSNLQAIKTKYSLKQFDNVVQFCENK